MNKAFFFKKFSAILILSLNTFPTTASSNEPQKWYLNSGINLTSASYSNSQTIKQKTNVKLLVDASYLDKTVLRFSTDTSQFSYHNVSTTYSQNTNGFSVNQYFFSDSLSGRTGVKLGLMKITGKNTIKNNILLSDVDYLNYKKNFYFNFSYIKSNYGNKTSGLDITQLKPTIGFQAYFSSLWLQLSAIDIHHSAGQNFTSLQYSLSHYSLVQNSFTPYSISFGGTSGKQQYYVDENNWIIYNSEDRLSQGLFISMTWNIKGETFVTLNGGRETFTSDSQSSYKINYISTTFSKTW